MQELETIKNYVQRPMKKTKISVIECELCPFFSVKVQTNFKKIIICKFEPQEMN